MYGIGYSFDGNLITKLFPGAIYDFNKLNIIVKIYDNDNAFTLYEINQPLIIIKEDLIQQEIEIEFDNLIYDINRILNQGNYLSTLEEIQRLNGLMNIISYIHKYRLKLFSSKIKII